MTELGDDGLQYLHRLLRNGDHLARALSLIPISEGRVWTYLPEGIDSRKVSLHAGSPEISNASENIGTPVVNLISSFLTAENSVFVLELDSLPAEIVASVFNQRLISYFTASPSKRTLTNMRGGVSLANVVGVYGYISDQQATREQISSLLLDRRPFGAVGALSTNWDFTIANGADTNNPQVFQSLADQIELIVASAYDDEGWIVWGRTLPYFKCA